jgi:hypothetical protein
LVGRLGWPEDSRSIALGSGIDPENGQIVYFTVDPAHAAALMAEVGHGEIPELRLGALDEVNWRRWFRVS